MQLLTARKCRGAAPVLISPVLISVEITRREPWRRRHRSLHPLRTSMALRNPSLSRLKQTLVTQMHTPGSMATIGWE